jgi:hypothetical protein
MQSTSGSPCPDGQPLAMAWLVRWIPQPASRAPLNWMTDDGYRGIYPTLDVAKSALYAIASWLEWSGVPRALTLRTLSRSNFGVSRPGRLPVGYHRTKFRKSEVVR